MRKNRLGIIVILLTAMLLPACVKDKDARADEEADKAAVEKVIDSYAECINRCDTALFGKIWSHGAGVSFKAPSGYYETYPVIRDTFLIGIFGTHFTQRNLEKKDVKVHLNGNGAWAEFRWAFSATRTDGAPHNTQGLETQIFEKGSDGVWRLVHVHYSSLKHRN